MGRKAACRTKELLLHGAENWDRVQPGPVTPAILDHLVGRYGAEAAEVIQLVAEDASLGEPLVPGLVYLRAEAVFAARHEMAVTLDDVLADRTRAHVLARDASAAAAEDVAELIGGVLGWTPDEHAANVQTYRDETRARAESSNCSCADRHRTGSPTRVGAEACTSPAHQSGHSDRSQFAS